LQIILQAIEPLFPQPAIFAQPVVDILERDRLDLARPHLRIAAARDQTGMLQHLEMLGDGRQAHRERFGQFRYRGLSEREAGEYGAPRRIGESGKGGAEAVGRLVGHGRYEPFG
jgi:hypothetical protein